MGNVIRIVIISSAVIIPVILRKRNVVRRRTVQNQPTMRLYVQIAGECLTVACRHEDTVADVGKEALRKLQKLKKQCQGQCYIVVEYRKTLGGSLLDPDDLVRDLLKDGEFMLAVLEGEATNGFAHPIVSQPQLSKVVHSPEDDLFHYYKDPAQFVPPTDVLVLDGESLTTEDLVLCGRGKFKLVLSKEAENRINKSRSLLDDIVNQNKVVYGVTTGFGNFANICISTDKIVQLQVNLIRSHCCGVGPPLPPSRVRMLLALRINVLAKGYSGISIEVVTRMIDALNAFCMPWVPEKGSVGCSGDLAPLAHLALGLMGEGLMWSPETGWDEAAKVLAAHNLRPIELAAKEGLALINGTQLVTALGAEAVERAESIARQADVVAALTLDVLKGTTRAFAADVHKVRPHRGQIRVAKILRSLLHSNKNPSQIAESHRFCSKVQDAYTLRCVPQVHGISHDTIDFVRQIITTELNSATDNPLVFGDKREIVSGGNFHGEYPAKVLDYLAIGIHEIAQISERRLERLINKDLSGLPAFLAQEPGLNSGFMMVQVTAASLVSENKVLTHPSSVDSIPTSGGQEDHVSMGGFAARKALRVIEHVEQVLAMELLAACQGLDFLKPLTSTRPLQDVHKLVRSVVPTLERDRFMAADIEAVTKLLQDGQIWCTVKPYLDSVALEMEDDDDLQPHFSPTTSNLNEEHEAKKRKFFHHMYYPQRRKSSPHEHNHK